MTRSMDMATGETVGVVVVGLMVRKMTVTMVVGLVVAVITMAVVALEISGVVR